MGACEFAHDGPEGISLMGIVLASRQRFFARHAPQDEYFCIRIPDRGEAVNMPHYGAENGVLLSSDTIVLSTL